MKPRTYCIGRLSLNHWMAGEVRCVLFLIHFILKITAVVNMHVLFAWNFLSFAVPGDKCWEKSPKFSFLTASNNRSLLLLKNESHRRTNACFKKSKQVESVSKVSAPHSPTKLGLLSSFPFRGQLRGGLLRKAGELEWVRAMTRETWPGWTGVPWLYWRVVGPRFSSVQFSSVAWSCLTLCNPMDCSTPGLPVHRQLPELAQTHVHWVGDAIQPSHRLSSPSPPAFNLSQHQGLFKWVSCLHQVRLLPEAPAAVTHSKWRRAPPAERSALCAPDLVGSLLVPP